MNLDALEALARQATPGPWGLLPFGEKDNSWGVCTAVDLQGRPLAGDLHDFETEDWLAAGEPDETCRFEVVDQICESSDILPNGHYIAAAAPDVVLRLIAVARAASALCADRMGPVIAEAKRTGKGLSPRWMALSDALADLLTGDDA